MKYQKYLSNAALGVVLFTSSTFVLSVHAHQDMNKDMAHGAHQFSSSSNMMMTEKMGNMDMSRMMSMMGGMGMSAMMESMSSMDMSMMMGKNKGMNMMRQIGITDLTEEQQRSINGLHDSMRKFHWNLMGSAMDEQATLRDALSVDRPDPEQVGEIYSRLFDLKRQMIESRLSTHNGVLDILTEEQAQQMEKHMMMSGNHGHKKMGGVTQ